MFNLNDSSFDAKEAAIIFNNGEAGITENVTLTVNKKKPEDKEGSPDYKLTFTDENGGSCNSSFWYVEKATDYASIEEQVQKQGKVMKHIIHCIYGDKMPAVSGDTSRAFLDSCMKAIRDGLAQGGKFRIFANYGSTQSVKQYIQPRSWVPFMERMTVSLADSRLKVSNIDAMSRIEKDTVSAPATADSIIEGDDW